MLKKITGNRSIYLFKRNKKKSTDEHNYSDHDNTKTIV
jgi:hypothetical protein